MAFTVRLIAYRGITTIPEPVPRQYHAAAVHILQEPYEWGQALESDGANPVTSVSDTAHDQVRVLQVEVPDGQGIRYEVRPPGGGRAVGVNSPRMNGTTHVTFYPGWTFEFIDIAAAP